MSASQTLVGTEHRTLTQRGGGSGQRRADLQRIEPNGTNVNTANTAQHLTRSHDDTASTMTKR